MICIRFMRFSAIIGLGAGAQIPCAGPACSSISAWTEGEEGLEMLQISSAPKLQDGIQATIATQQDGIQASMAAKSQSISKLVWSVGDSNSWRVMTDACYNAKANMTEGDGIWEFYCTFDGITLIQTFFPGTRIRDDDPPYYRTFKESMNIGQFQNSTARDLFESKLKSIRLLFGKTPDVVLVGSDLWDVAAWWQNKGSPSSWPTPHGHVNLWCQSKIPQLLDVMQQVVPNAHVAFRTPAPCFNEQHPDFPFRQSIHETVNEMAACIRKSAYNATHLFAATGPRYRLLDWNNIVPVTFETLKDTRENKSFYGDMRNWYDDSWHPGPSLRGAVVAATLDWVREI